MSENDTLTGELEQETVNAIADTATSEQDVKDYFNDLVGDEKKYKSPQDLAKAYIHADLHIRELRDKLDDLQSNDELLKEVLTELRKQPETNANPAPANTPAPADRSDVDIDKVVSTKLAEREAAAKAKANRDKSLDLLSQYYGDRSKALEAIRTKIGGNDAIREVINRLGDSAPEEAFRYITGEAPSTDITSRTGHPNTPGMEGKPPAHMTAAANGRLTWARCQEIRKKNPREYNSPEFRMKIEQAVAEYERQGKDFFST